MNGENADKKTDARIEERYNGSLVDAVTKILQLRDENTELRANQHAWIKCSDRLPEPTDDGVLVFFAVSRSIETVHRQDYFGDITAGVDRDGNQLFTKRYIEAAITHWMQLPEPPAA